MQVRLDTVDTADTHDRVCDRGCVPLVRNLAVDDRDVVLDHDVHPRNIEPLLERSETRTNAVGEHIVTHIRVGPPGCEPVEDPGCPRRCVAHIAGEARCKPSGGATDCGVGRRSRHRADHAGRQARGLHEAFRVLHVDSLAHVDPHPDVLVARVPHGTLSL